MISLLLMYSIISISTNFKFKTSYDGKLAFCLKQAPNFDFLTVIPKYNEDGTCGQGSVGSDGVTSPAWCNPNDTLAIYCCSDQGTCGSGPAFCDCPGCHDYRPVGKGVTDWDR